MSGVVLGWFQVVLGVPSVVLGGSRYDWWFWGGSRYAMGGSGWF